MELKICVVSVHGRSERHARGGLRRGRSSPGGPCGCGGRVRGMLEGCEQINGNRLALHRDAVRRNTIPENHLAAQDGWRIQIGVRLGSRP